MGGYTPLAARKAAWERNSSGSHLYHRRKLQRQKQSHHYSLQHLSYLPAIFAE